MTHQGDLPPPPRPCTNFCFELDHCGSSVQPVVSLLCDYQLLIASVFPGGVPDRRPGSAALAYSEACCCASVSCGLQTALFVDIPAALPGWLIGGSASSSAVQQDLMDVRCKLCAVPSGSCSLRGCPFPFTAVL